ncbi:hypothetical protein OH77DRAFT_1431920 [Trametes cingulata]|nr:hypothetical protein OH77DRAFT_1431920 [Trametes cingulata]
MPPTLAYNQRESGISFLQSCPSRRCLRWPQEAASPTTRIHAVWSSALILHPSRRRDLRRRTTATLRRRVLCGLLYLDPSTSSLVSADTCLVTREQYGSQYLIHSFTGMWSDARTFSTMLHPTDAIVYQSCRTLMNVLGP